MGCAESKRIDGKIVEPYGLINKKEVKQSDVLYKLNKGSVILGIIFCETVIVPIYIFGYDLYEPVGE
jgi:hypothetical protein